MNKFLSEAVKMYKITFRDYTNACRNVVSYYDKGQFNYLDTTKDYTGDDGYLIIREDEIEKYQQYGNGIKEMEFVGYAYLDNK